MPLYASYTKLTSEGAKSLKEGPKRLGQIRGWIEEAGGKIVAAYATMGRYDYLMIIDMPDKAGWSVVAKIATLGALSTETVEIIPMEEWMQTVASA